MPEKNFTTRFKVDISDLKKNITEANKQIKLANATFKAETAGMTDWSKNATGLAAKLKQLNSNLDEQKKVLTSYREQLKKQNDAYTENGKRIEEARAKLKQLEETVGKSDEAYKKQKEALRAIEQEQQRNATAADKLKVQILNQTAAVNKTEAQIKKYSDAEKQLEQDTKILSGEFGTQEEKLEALKRQYDRVAASEGKDSDEAKKLSKQIEDLTSDLKKNQSELSDSESKSDKLKSSFDKLRTSASKVGSTISSGLKKSLAGITAGLGAVTAGAVVAGKKIVDEANKTAEAGDEVDKMSQKLGLSAKAYQEWDYILSQSGVEITSMTAGMKTLTNQIDAAKNGNQDAIDRFNKLGISISDLKNLSREDVFGKVVQGMQGLADNSDRAALANKILGRSGQSLTPLFNETAASTEELRKKAHDLGMVMSDEAVSASAKYKDSLDTLKRTFTGAKNGIVTEMLPAFTDLVTGFSNLMSGSKDASKQIESGATKIINSLKKALPKVVSIAGSLAKSVAKAAPDVIRALVTNIGGGLKTALKSIDWKGIVNFATGLLKDTALLFNIKLDTSKLGSSIKGLETPVKNLFGKISDLAQKVIPVIVDKLLPSIITAISNIMEGITPIVSALTPVITKVTEIAATIIEKLSPIFKTMGELIAKVIETLTPIFEPIGKIITSIIDVLSPVLSVIFNVLSGILSVLTPIFQTVGNIINLFTGAEQEVTISDKVKAELDNLAAASEDVSKVSKNIEDTMSSVNESIKSSAADVQYIDDLKTKLENLLSKADLSDDDEKEIKTIADLLAEKLPTFKDTWDKMVSKDDEGHLQFSKNRQQMVQDIDDIINKLKEQYATEALQNQYEELVKKKYESNVKVRESIDKIKDAEEKSKEASDKASKAHQEYIDAIKKYGKFSDEAKEKLDAYTQAADEADKYNKTLEGLQAETLKLYGEQGKLDEQMISINDTIDVMSGKFDKNKDNVQKLRNAYSNGFIDLDTIKKNYKINSDELFKMSKSTAEKSEEGYAIGIKNGIDEIKRAGASVGVNAIKATQQALDEHSPSKVYEGIGTNTIKGFNVGVKNNIESSVKTMNGFTSAVVTAAKRGLKPLKTMFSTIPDALKSALNSALGYFEGFLASITSGINFMFSKINDLNRANANGKKYTIWHSVKAPTIPRLALGGIVNQPTFAQIGERGAEAIIPLSQNAAWVKAVASNMLETLRQGTVNNSINNMQSTTNKTDYNFTQVINAPQSPTALENYRNGRQLLALMKAAGGA